MTWKEKAQKLGHAEGFEAGKNQGLSGKAIRQDYNRVSKKVSVKGIATKEPFINEWQGLLAEFRAFIKWFR